MMLSVIIPVYNEEKTIKTVIKKLKQVSLPGNVDMEIIIVDDSSTDSTPEILRKIDGIRVLRNRRNMGKGYAVRRALKYVSGGVVVFQDADLEYDPREISILMKEILKGEVVVYGSRFRGTIKGMSFSHWVGNKVISLVTSILFGQKITDTETCYKMFRKEALEGISLRSDRFGIEPEITAKFLKKGIKISEVPIKYRGRKKTEKKINWKDGIKAVWHLLKFRFSD